MLKGNIKKEYAIACAWAVICYCFQAMVNLNLPITAPLLWGMLSMGIAIMRSGKIKNENSQTDMV